MNALPPFKEVPFAPVDIEMNIRADGTILMKSRVDVTLREPHLPGYLARQAVAFPNRLWLAKRSGEKKEWRTLTFSQGKAYVDSLTQALLNLDLNNSGTLTILSGNSIEHALMMFAGMQASIPVAPISAAYSLMSSDYSKLKEVIETAKPSVIFVQDGLLFSDAVKSISSTNPIVIAAENAQSGQLWLRDLLQTKVTPDVADAVQRIDVDKPAKIMFTSGSTGSPKGVQLSQTNLVLAAESNLTTTGRLEEGERIRLDWAPWSHVMGATTLSLATIEGGSFYIDDGKPVPHLFGQTIANLAEIQPDLFMTVPAAIGALVDTLEAEPELAGRILEKLTCLGFGGAALPAATAARFEKIAIKHTGKRITIQTGYGSTETGPGGGFVHWLTDQTGTLGLAQPGYEMKLSPIGDERYEVRIRSKGVTSGYLGRPDLLGQMFDDDGYYKMGDAVTLADAQNPLAGLIFAGRMTEEFKLLNGSFVRVGAVRGEVLEAFAPLLRDVVICGENQPYLGALAWLNLEAAKRAIGNEAVVGDIEDHPIITAALQEKLDAYNRTNKSATTSVVRLKLLKSPPSIDLGEVTDKGSINQRAVIRRRASEVEVLFSQGHDANILQSRRMSDAE